MMKRIVLFAWSPARALPPLMVAIIPSVEFVFQTGPRSQTYAQYAVKSFSGFDQRIRLEEVLGWRGRDNRFVTKILEWH